MRKWRITEIKYLIQVEEPRFKSSTDFQIPRMTQPVDED